MAEPAQAREPEPEYIFVASFVHPKTGKRIFARDHGKKAFRIPVKRK